MSLILIIDDDHQVRAVITRALERDGYRVIQANDGEEGARMAQEHTPSLVLTDILMPNKEGLQVIRELRMAYPAVPIIAMSGGGSSIGADGILKIARHLGAQHALLKPFSLAELLSVVAATIGQSPPAARADNVSSPPI
jgi:DNA-binding response OmpR family regulator